MASTVNPSDKNATAHILQGVGTWTEDQGRGIGNANLEKGKSEGLQHTISGGLAVENHLTSQYTPTFGKSDMGATDAAWPSRDGDRGETNVRQRVPNTSADESTPMGINTPTNTQLVQFHRYLSVPAKSDPWHGMRYAPSHHTQFITNGDPRVSRSSTPSSLRTECGSGVTDQRRNGTL